ncbi:hypothetical protein HMPREF0591_5387 [Mycobacterium parascrofulaceum ATCC BAA-614]|jgi:hypothetical protein|uniref:Uncharacterized protein n=1 Tax=Mycobacterium parascrofulaceum ATCC BAA-614 TaxID=525368 RepID=D5PGU3_9MYCO|nr:MULTISPECIES: hypothetical protein [Mycobacterium]EFG74797.1 hypothetical protein HMPREF0591_5387 [Mycobacterium parascrofulaceum ATCC BAA-614]OCB26970.1 hypothetical protein A9X02_04310 [Mycobacterium malmoense]
MSVAPKAKVHVSIDDDIEFLSEQLERLRALGEEKAADDVFGDEDIYDLSVRWGTALAGRLPRIAHYSSIGLLDEADERRFQSLCDELRAVSPLIDRFKLARPDLGDCPDTRASGRHRRDDRATGWRRRPRA